ncbi:Integrase core domain protein [Planctomycetes bacterium K23_9]|uniref:Integrase core domain protein n=1 Tax=Stieleria marina TaxID=1930275 RepID=A0A517P0M0_9BACT|nr:Integrase core domain protein [Planctomycetes bacterium K23_9]
MLCRTLEVTRAAYYQFTSREPTANQTKQIQITQAIREVRKKKHHDAYGSPGMHRELLERGIQCCRNTVAKFMRKAGIKANRRSNFRISTSDSNHDQPIAANLLRQNFSTASINQVWLTDITYVPLAGGKFTYLCAFIDLHSRKVVGWKTSRNIDSELAVAALRQAVALRSPGAGLIVHSDRGCQYASEHFRNSLAQNGFIQSMRRRGNCYDNAPMESFFKSYKTEEANEKYETHEHATRDASNYIEQFYNSVRRHSSLNFQSPIDFERQLQTPILVGDS